MFNTTDLSLGSPVLGYQKGLLGSSLLSQPALPLNGRGSLLGGSVTGATGSRWTIEDDDDEEEEEEEEEDTKVSLRSPETTLKDGSGEDDQMSCSLLERHLRCSTFTTSIVHEASTSEDDPTSSCDKILLTFIFQRENVNVRTKFLLPKYITASTAKLTVAKKLSSRYSFLVDPDRYVLRLYDLDLPHSEYLYGDVPLRAFDYVREHVSTEKGVEIEMLPLSRVLEVVKSGDRDRDDDEKQPVSIVRSARGKAYKVRRRNTVRKQNITTTATTADTRMDGNFLVVHLTHSHTHRLPGSVDFLTTQSVSEVQIPLANLSLPHDAPKPSRGRSNTQTRKRGFTAQSERGLLPSRHIRGLVSKKKIRYQENGYDLDLTYITPSIIAMGFPAIGKEAYYRNRMEVVEDFFEENHPGCYKIYNLCEERTYELARFKGNHVRYPFFDHCPPPFSHMMVFCKDVKKFLDSDPNAVVSIHCKAGKGRTGTMICAYLLYSGLVKTAEESLTLYGNQRTSDGKGVTIPSQIRYVHYFNSLLLNHAGVHPPERAVIFQFLRLTVTPRYHDGGCDPFLVVHRISPQSSDLNEKIYDSKEEGTVRYVVAQKDVDIKLARMVVVRGDIQVQLFHLDRMTGKSHKIFQFFFNTSFLPTGNVLRLTKAELDKANKDKDNKYMDASFAVECYFKTVEDLPQRSRPLPDL